MPGQIQKHTLVYTVVIAALLAVFFDLSRIASLGAIFYLVMDIAIHWGVLRHLRQDVEARGWILIAAIVLDAVILAAFIATKTLYDPLIVIMAIVAIAMIFFLEALYLHQTGQQNLDRNHSHEGHD